MAVNYFTPDTTGTDLRYQKANVPSTIYRVGQVIKFRASPVFFNSIVIMPVGSNQQALTPGIDFVYDDTMINDDATGEALIANPNFTGVLVDQVVIKTTKALPFQVALTFQEFYRTSPGDYFGDGTPYTVSPGLISDIQARTAALSQQFARVGSTLSETTAVPSFFPEDINEELPTNKVTGEIHQINTVEGIKFIAPVNGPFFRDSVSLSVNGTPLDEGVDYQVDTFDRERSSRSTNVGGIYRFIQIISPQSGPVSFDYHPVGGQVTISDLSDVWDRLTSVVDFLNGTTFLTSGSINSSPAIQAVLSRILELETTVRKLLTTPNYSDATAGSSVQKIFTATDAKLHWYSIASLYQVAGSTDITLADSFHGRIFFPVNNVSCEFVCDVNLNTNNKKASFKTLSLVLDPKYTLFGNVSAAAAVYPVFRLVYSTANSQMSGLVLQVGLANPSLSDTPVIEDLSSVESCWLLDKTSPVINGQPAPTPIAPQDSGFLLPDGKTVWGAAGDTASVQILMTPELPEGYLVYAGGGVKINSFDASAAGAWAVPSVLPAYLAVDTIRRLRLVLTLPDGTNSEVIIPMSGKTGVTKTGMAAIPMMDGTATTITATIDPSKDPMGVSLQIGGTVGQANTTAVSYILAEV